MQQLQYYLQSRIKTYCVLCAAGNGNNINKDANANNIFFLLTKTQNYMFL